MSQLCSLPRPIRDPVSGKTYIAIPAPPFILAHNDTGTPQYSGINSAPGFVYVEHKSAPPPQRMFTPERSELPKGKLSINKWMVQHRPAQPPPGHIPWTGQVPTLSMDGSLDDITSATPTRGARPSLFSIALDSTSTLEISSMNSGDSLLNGSLPSTRSSIWSAGVSPPPVAYAKTAKPLSSSSPTACASGLRLVSKSKRYTACLPPSSHREALVLEGCSTLKKTENVEPLNTKPFGVSSTPKGTQLLSQIENLDAFFSNGLKKMTSTIRHLDEEKERLETPSLIVSTSTAVLPVSLESFADLKNVTPPLAMRRGKKVPIALKIDNTLTANALDYPEVPTAFRGSPGSGLDTFPDAPSYPTLVLDPKMTAEQMISSLRSQVDNFYPRQTLIAATFADQCTDAEKWLEDELAWDSDRDDSSVECSFAQHSLETEIDSVDATELSASSLPVPSASGFRKSSISGLRAKGLRPIWATTPSCTNAHGGSEVKAPSENLKDWNALAWPRGSILSDDTRPVLKPSVEKKVRFSASPPLTIPHNILEMGEWKGAPPTPRPKTAAPNVIVFPTKRKPPPSVCSVKSPVVKVPLQSTPKKSPVVHKPLPTKPARITTPRTVSSTPSASKKATASGKMRSLSTGSTLTDSPLRVSPSIRRRASEIGPSSRVSSPKPATDVKIGLPELAARPFSFSTRDSRSLKVSVAGITFGKRRSFDSDKENQGRRGPKSEGPTTQKMEQIQKKLKAGRTRSLPFQNVLNRLRG
ncbi:hypothetical protein M0805_006672 [Coniferiporia weirii]|nr:hypothetical protein M0805_006672 [Coniferiporia weirii]